MKKHRLIIFSLAVMALFVVIFFFYDEPAQSHVYFFDVGQGDSALIRTEDGQTILIDGGPDQSVIGQLGKALPFYERTIDLMILTHPHDDHVAGLNDVLERFDVRQIGYTGVAHTGPAFMKWLDSLKRAGLTIKLFDRPQTIRLNSQEALEIIYPFADLRKGSADNLNNTSVVAKYINRSKSVLFVGDIEEPIEKELLGKKIDLRADILKLGHHGSDTSGSEDFLKAVAPANAVITVGIDNKFGHPSLRVLKRLQRMGIRHLKTSEEGTIVLKFGKDGYYFEK